jgi:branched-chain amino acid transport system substrate-binding protein
MAHFAFNYLDTRTAVVFSNINYGTYIQAAGVFAESFSRRGGQVMAIESFSSEDDFTRFLKKYTANPPAVIFCPEDFIPAAVLINTVYELGFRNTFLLGTDAWDGILTYVFNPRAMLNVYYSAPFSFDDPDEEVVTFVRNYFDSFSQMPLAGSASAYTSVYLMANAIEKAGNTNWNDIVSAMKATELDTILGRISFNENNNPYINAYVIQIKDGQYSAFKKLITYGD